MTVFDLQAILRLDKSQYEQGLNQAESETNGMSGKLSAGLLILSNLATSAIQAVGRASVSFVKDTVAVGMDFDKSMSQVAATMGKTVDEIEDLRDFAQEMGRTTVFSATQAADALNYMALAGYDTQESMEMLPNVLNLAAAGNFDLARASDMVTDTQTAFGISAERTTQLVDEMAKAASTGNTSVEQLGDAFLVVGGLAQELNGGLVTLSDGTTASVDGVQELEIALTAMANAGVKGSEAGTHMRNMLLKLSSPTDEGVQMMTALGVSVFDTEGKMRSLSDIFGDLSLRLSDLTQEEKIQAISELFNTRDLASAEALLNAVNSDWNEIGEAILNAQGAAEKMADTQLDNLAGDVTLFQSALEGARIAISDKLSPTLRQFVQFGTNAVSEITAAFQSNGFTGAMDVFARYLSEGIDMIGEYLPTFIKGIASIVSEVVPTLLSTLVKQAPAIISTIAEALGGMIPGIANALGDLLLNLPAMLVSVTGGIVNGFINLFTGIFDSVKKQAELVVPDDLADGYVGRIQTNFEKSLDDGLLNLKTAVANLIGNTEWSSALENMRLASELQDKIVEDYNTAMAAMDEYSFENFQIATEAKITTAMTLLGALQGMIDEDGNITGDLGVVQQYIDDINSVLGEGAVTLDATPADWIIKIAEQYQDEEGNITDPESLRADIEAGLNAALSSDESINLAEQTYEAVSKVLSGYTEEQALSDKTRIRNDIEAELLDQKVAPATAKVIADALLEEGSVRTWYETGVSSAWDNSAFIAYLQEQGYLPRDTETATASAVAEVATKFMMGEIDKDEFQQELDNLDLTDEQKERVITYTVSLDGVEQAKQDLKELEAESYRASLRNAFSEATVENAKNYTAALNLASEAEKAFADGITGAELDAYNDDLNSATMALNEHEAEARQMWSTYYDLTGGVEAYGDKESFVQEMINNDTSLQTRTAELDALRESEALYAAQLVETAGGYDNLTLAEQNSVAGIVSSLTSWGSVAETLGYNKEQMVGLAGLMLQYMTEVGEGADTSKSAIESWILASGELPDSYEEWGIDIQSLARILAALFENGALTEEMLTGMKEKMDEAGDSASTMSDEVEDAVDNIKNSADGMGEAGKSMKDAFMNEMNKTKMEMTRVGTVASSNFSGSVLAGQPNAVQKAGMFINGTMNAMVAAINARQTDVETAVGDVESGAEEAMDPLKENMSETGDTSASNLDESFGAWATTVGQTVTGMYQLFTNTFGNLPNEMSVWGAQMGDSFHIAFAGSSAYEVISDAGAIADGMIAEVSGLSDAMYWQFYYAGQGAYNGFIEWATPLVNAARNTANRLIAETARGLDNNSPSKEMRKQYGYAGEGAYLGWLDWSDRIVDAVNSTADDVTNGLNYSVEYPQVASVSAQGAAIAQMEQREILNLLLMYLPQLVNRDVVLDGGQVVGGLMPEINTQMESNLDLARRGVHA